MRSWFVFSLVLVALVIPSRGAAVETQYPELAGYCALVAQCGDGGEQTLDACLSDADETLRIVAGVDHETCRALLQALLDRYSCESALTCDTLADPGACGAEGNRVADLVVNTSANSCLVGHVPVEVPDSWSCSRFYFAGGDADGCDCGCGAVDPDCDGGGCSEEGCFDGACEYCYVGGFDVGCAPPDPGPGEGEGEEGEGEGEGELVPGPSPPPPSSCAGAGDGANSALCALVLICFAARRSGRGIRHPNIL